MPESKRLSSHACSYISHSGDMGVELGIADFSLRDGDYESLLPSWHERAAPMPLDVEIQSDMDGDDVDGDVQSLGSGPVGEAAAAAPAASGDDERAPVVLPRALTSSLWRTGTHTTGTSRWWRRFSATRSAVSDSFGLA